MIRGIFLAVIVIVACYSCNRQYIEDYDANFSGTWRNRDTLENSRGVPVTCYIHIDGENSEIAMLCDSTLACWQEMKGKITINRKHRKLTIHEKGALHTGWFRYDINELPFQNANGQWQFTLENVVLIRD